MKIIKAFPPIFAELTRHFPIKGVTGILYAWGDRIYNPSGVSVPEWLMAHETVHGRRQLATAELSVAEAATLAWWQKYIHDHYFRLNEEVPAHQKEWEVIRGLKIPGDTKEMYLLNMANRLSGPLYNHLVGHGEALDLIQGRR